MDLVILPGVLDMPLTVNFATANDFVDTFQQWLKSNDSQSLTNLESMSKLLEAKLNLRVAFNGAMSCPIDDPSCQIIDDIGEGEFKITFDSNFANSSKPDQQVISGLLLNFVEKLNQQQDAVTHKMQNEAMYDV
ncbi:MAG: hypothetical protein ACRCXZ_06060 [Patescibacteria group bacterium]